MAATVEPESNKKSDGPGPEVQTSPVTSAPAVSVDPLPPSSPTTPAGVAKTYICTMVPDGEDGPPEVFEAGSLEALVSTIYQTMLRMGKGWCIPIINGERAAISAPKQIFYLKFADGSKVVITDPEGVSFEAHGRFSTLSVKTP